MISNICTILTSSWSYPSEEQWHKTLHYLHIREAARQTIYPVCFWNAITEFCYILLHNNFSFFRWFSITNVHSHLSRSRTRLDNMIQGGWGLFREHLDSIVAPFGIILFKMFSMSESSFAGNTSNSLVVNIPEKPSFVLIWCISISWRLVLLLCVRISCP